MIRITFLCFLAFFFLPSLSFAAQSTADTPVTLEQKDALYQKLVGAKPEKPAKEDPYIIGHGDILTVTIFEEGDMAASAIGSTNRSGQETDVPRTAESGNTVMMDGRISLRHIGDVEVVGLTLAELADYLKQLYSSIFEDPIITTTLVQSNSLRYTVMGEVTNPGIFFLDFPITAVQVIARSGGFTEWAKKRVTVVRKYLKKADEKLFSNNTCELDYDDFISGKSLERNIFIRSGDIIIVH
jgi:polysaccharide export outer membrane protein